MPAVVVLLVLVVMVVIVTLGGSLSVRARDSVGWRP